MRPARLLSLAAAAALALALAAMPGCIYRMDIQQGNLLDADQVEQVEVGMTRSQVRYLLGTPMVIDSFNHDRWDYVYSLQRGHKRKVERRHLVIWFDGDKVARVEEPRPVPRKPAAVAAPPAAPAQPPSTAPG